MDFGFYSSYVALWIWVIFQGLLTLAVFRQVMELEKRTGKWEGTFGGESLVGVRAPKFSGSDFHSGRFIDLNFFDGQGGVILFLTARCSICRYVSRGLQAVPLETLPPIVAICTGDTKATMKLAKRLGPQIPLLLDGAEDTVSVYKVFSYPTVVVLDSERRIRAHSGISKVEDLQRLAGRTTTDDTKDEDLVMTTTPSGQNA